jgi:hypothetical protein
VLSPSSLTSVISNHSLYQSERAKMPIEDVIEGMRKSIFLLPVHTASGSEVANAVIIQYVSDDPATAQKVTQELSSGFIDQNMLGRRGSTSMTLELLDPASLPRNPAFPNRPLITTVGLAAGLAVGVILAWRRRPRNHCPRRVRPAAGLLPGAKTLMKHATPGQSPAAGQKA